MPENMPESAPLSPERGVERSPIETRGAVAPQATPIAVPPIAVPTVAPQATATTDDTNPAVAADEDLIEKEWIAKAKQVVHSTKDDPHAQAEQVGKMTIDYVMKRYGKQIGKAEE